MSDELTKLKRKRTSKKNIVLNQIFPACETVLQEVKNDETIEEATTLLDTLVEKVAEVKLLYEEVSDAIDDDAAHEENEKEAYEFELKSRKIEGKLHAFIDGKRIDVKPRMSDVGGIASQQQNQRVKLPKLEIEKFSGDATKWRTFIETFDATVDVRSDISNVEKFSYLRGYLQGNALQTIDGMPLSSANYVEAKELLEKRYGNQQLITATHMNALVNLDRIVSANAKDLRKLHDKVETNIRALESAGVSSTNFGPLLIPIVLGKLPDVVRLQISRKLGTENWSISEFMKSVNDEVSARENFQYLKANDSRKDEDSNAHLDPRTLQALALTTLGQSPKLCVFCDSTTHYSDKCDVVTDVRLRLVKVREINLCFRCLKAGHRANRCKNKKVYCFRCKVKNKHHTALCDKELDDNGQQKTLATGSDDMAVVLQSATGFLCDDENEKRVVKSNILLDNCSQQTFITERIAQKLELKVVVEKQKNINAFGSSKGTGMLLKKYKLVLKPIDKSTNIDIVALAVPVICAPLCRKYNKMAKEQNEFVKALKLADNGSHDNNNVDILIGADIYWDIVSGNLKRNPKTGIVAISSELGWLLNGPVSREPEEDESGDDSCMSIHTLSIQSEVEEKDELTAEVKKFWNLDVVGISENDDEGETKVEELVEPKINPSTGRYSCELPLKEGHPLMPDNYTLCEKQLLNLKKQLDKNDELKEKYDEIFKHQEKEKIIEKVTDPGVVGEVTYLPHRPVERDDKLTTKVRPVFNGGARRKNQVSLNDILHTGPNLLPKIYEMLLKFRMHQIAITADIEKAYLQIEIDEKNRDLLRFLYFSDINAENPEIIAYRFCRVPFGITPSQYLMIRVVRKHGEKYKEIDPEFSRVVDKHLFSDDLNTGADNVKQGLEMYKKMKIRFGEAHFNFRKWRTSSEELRSLIPQDDLMSEDDEKVLGEIWNHTKDTIHMSVSEIFLEAEELNPTKRNILKLMAKIFDPVGFLTPITVSLHLLFQEIWVAGSDWDDQINEELNKKWILAVKSLKKSAELVIPRRYFIDHVNDPIDKIFLHGFSDASGMAYGACVYIQAVSRSENVQVSFVTSKSRVKPARKDFSIPRMELLGNFVLAKLMKLVYETLSEEKRIDDYFCWTDAKVTLAWIRSTEKKFTVFIENRLKKIRRCVSIKKWDYVSTKENPADLITRCYSENLAESKLWTEGPDFLKKVTSNLEVGLAKGKKKEK